MRTVKFVPQRIALITFLIAGAALALSPKVLATTTCNSNQNPNPQTPATLNVPEVTVAGGVRTPTTVTLDGSGSRGSTFSWAQTGGTPTVSLSGADTAIATFTAPEVGPAGLQFTFTLSASCNDDTKTKDVSVRIVNVNQAPSANAGSDDSTIEGSTVTLSGSGADPDGDALTLTWTQIGGSPSVTLGGTGAVRTFTAPSVGTGGTSLTFRLTAFDGSLAATDDKVVSILNSNEPPIPALACPVSSVAEGDLVTLDASASTDPDDGIASYLWDQLISPPNVGVQGSTTSSVSFTAPQLQNGYNTTLGFKVTVTDFGGLFETAKCSVTIRDVTPPTVAVPANMSLEATMASGAQATYVVTASDVFDGVVSASCQPASGSIFALGKTTVSCEAFDSAGNKGTAKFDVTVVDTTPPSFTAPSDMTVEATSAAGAIVTYVSSATSDLVSGAGTADCTPASGTQFGLGETTVSCTASDAASNSVTKTFRVKVVDTTAPVIAPHADETAEATSAAGAVVNYMPPNSTDAVDGTKPASCAPATGSLFALGETTVTCNATDAAGNSATATTFKVKVGDTTAPVIAAHGDETAEATSAAGAIVNYTPPNSTDAVDGTKPAICTPASGSTFPLGTTTVTCNKTDAAGNAATATTFKVTVKDTTAPVIAAHGDETAEATSAAGAVVSYTPPNSTDAVDGTLPANCAPASGGTFPLGSTTVTCNKTDAAGNAATSTTFQVTVKDTTPPVIAAHADEPPVEATSAAGAVVNYTPPNSTDAVDGILPAICAPATGSTFPLGNTTVTCNKTDTAGNAATATTFKVTVRDTTPPVIAAHGDETAEATSAAGAAVNYAPPTSSDAVDGAKPAVCSPAPGSTFALGTSTVTCNKTDAAGNAAVATTFKVTVRDTTAPVIAAHGDETAEATSALGAVVNYTPPNSTDAVDGTKPAVCAPASAGTFPLGTTTVTCNRTDAAGNAATPTTFKVTVRDTLPPVISAHADITVDATSGAGAIVTYTAPDSTDIVDGVKPATCSPASGMQFAVGTTTVTCNKTDAAGNTATATTFKVNVLYKFAGFFNPINNSALNSVKAGQAIPVKFSLGGNMGMAIFDATYPRVVSASCSSGYVDEILDTETINAGGSSLNYDASANQYVYVWKTEKSWAGICVQLQVKLNDGTIHTASFGFTK